MAEPTAFGRPLTRSLDPLPGESLGGYLLRLAHRLHPSPIRLARLTGCTKQPSTTPLGRMLLLDLDVVSFARATRLSEEEAAAPTFFP
ncbi:TniQ family protein [Streptomyces sp. NPDC086549]|uniref:TniQ family protein n=1 Tax=Streptomyces sp. NPDC086549 TaxID=3365752 RepID=UPI0037FC3CE7